ncbi:MAG TPA: carboxypeptidase-like regulatory domain-containing protein [Bryocella sp.]|nr:carboxypeptidase-like regulatory domain-containing protein [Bryocella sp.]
MHWYKLLGTLLLAFVATVCSAQLEVPLGGSHSGDNTPTRKTRPTTRILTGTVLDKSDKPISEAIVYLKNTKTLAVKTYISQNDGTYRFPELSLNSDYEVYAEKEGKKSKTKTVSQFDDREKPNINLQIDTTK